MSKVNRFLSIEHVFGEFFDFGSNLGWAKGRSRQNVWNALLKKAKNMNIHVFWVDHINDKETGEKISSLGHQNEGYAGVIYINAEVDKTKRDYTLAYQLGNLIYKDQATEKEKAVFARVLIMATENGEAHLVNSMLTNKDCQDRVLENIQSRVSEEVVA